MKIDLVISDADYQRIIAAAGKRVKGSMGMISPSQFDFHSFNIEPPSATSRTHKELRTRHGWARVSDEVVKVQFRVKRVEGVSPSSVIWDESGEAAEFVENNA